MGHLARIGKHDFASLRRAMAYGTVAASFTVEDFSLRRLEGLALEEIEDRLRQYSDMLRLG
ncbi:MAG: sugar kinase, partial [Phycisphaerae bacterium]